MSIHKEWTLGSMNNENTEDAIFTTQYFLRRRGEFSLPNDHSAVSAIETSDI